MASQWIEDWAVHLAAGASAWLLTTFWMQWSNNLDIKQTYFARQGAALRAAVFLVLLGALWVGPIVLVALSFVDPEAFGAIGVIAFLALIWLVVRNIGRAYRLIRLIFVLGSTFW